jgi:hypothetical protein
VFERAKHFAEYTVFVWGAGSVSAIQAARRPAYGISRSGLAGIFE